MCLLSRGSRSSPKGSGGFDHGSSRLAAGRSTLSFYGTAISVRVRRPSLRPQWRPSSTRPFAVATASTRRLRPPISIGYATRRPNTFRSGSGSTPSGCRTQRPAFSSQRIPPTRYSNRLDLVRRVGANQWKTLTGSPRLALDLRIAAESLLQCDDDLNNRVPDDPDCDVSHPTRRHLRSRLAKKRGLDEVLTEYGLSPHPSLVVVLEGKTEMVLWKFLTGYYHVSADEDFITVVDGKGVDRDLTSLMTFAAPRLAAWPIQGTLQLLRPATRFLVISDAEKKMATPEKRDARRRDWVDLLIETVPEEHRTQAMRAQIELLVSTETWNEAGESFEFANFTAPRAGHGDETDQCEAWGEASRGGSGDRPEDSGRTWEPQEVWDRKGAQGATRS